jgi:hypothetical protein
MSINFKVLAVFKEDENMRVAVKLLEKKEYDAFHETSVFQLNTASKIDAIIHKQKSLETHKSIERLALRIVQEINNPLTISGQLQLRLSQMGNGSHDYHIFETLEEETQRIAETVRSLLSRENYTRRM